MTDKANIIVLTLLIVNDFKSSCFDYVSEVNPFQYDLLRHLADSRSEEGTSACQNVNSRPKRKKGCVIDEIIQLTVSNTILFPGPRCDAPLDPTVKIFYRRLYIKRCVFAIFQQELQNSTMFGGLLS